MKRTLQLFLIMGIFVFAFTNCSSSEKGTDKMKVEEAPPPLSPGTVKVEAEIIKVTMNDNGSVYKLKVLKILELGPTTSGVAENSEIDALVSKSLENPNLSEGKVYQLLLRGGSPVGEESMGSSWKITKIY